MSTDNENIPPQQPRRRRSSIAEIFGGRPSVDTGNGTKPKPAGSAMATAMAQAQQQTRRLSITALGLSGSPTRGQPQGPFETMRDRQGSAGGSARPSEGDETAIDEDGDSVGPMNGDAGSRPSSPTARRMSFGARAYRDIRVSTGGSSSASAPDGGGSANSSKGSSPPTAKKDGFNWGENLRTRAQRSSISAAAGSSGAPFPSATGTGATHGRSKSVAEQPAPPAPKPPPPQAPDHFQERILKGDFYMD